MATDLDDDDKEMAALEAAMAAEDQAHGAVEQEAGDEPAAGEPTDTPTEGEPAAQVVEPPADATPAATAATPDKPADPAPVVAGVLSKDGKTVLPYGALKGARQEAKQYRERAAKLEAELADLKAGKKPEPSDELTPEYIAELATDFPQLERLAKTVAQVSQRAAPATQPEAEAEAEDPVQDAIDAVPLLAEWQSSDPEKFARATAHDKVLEDSPKWRGKPLTERFAHVAKLVADEYDIQTPAAAAPSVAAPTQRKAPEQVIESAARAAPNTLSDMKGGAAEPSRDSLERMTPIRQMRRMEEMSDDEIDAYLRKVG